MLPKKCSKKSSTKRRVKISKVDTHLKKQNYRKAVSTSSRVLLKVQPLQDAELTKEK